MKNRFAPLLLALAIPLIACPPVDPDVVPVDDDDDAPAPETYEFDSRFAEGSSVSYSGQIFRHVLVHDLKGWIGGMTDRLDEGWFPADGDVVAELDFFYLFDGDTSGGLAHGVTTDPATLQTVYADIASGKDLTGKLAGNDPVGQHADWATDFAGWDDPAVTTPESLVRLWMEQLEDQAIAWSAGDYPLGPDGSPVGSVHVTPEGLDLQQLLSKFVLGAIAYSQGSDDYLDDDTDGKGLLSDNTAPEEGKPFTALEHAWDEGFGYFGAARDYSSWTDEEIASVGFADTDADGAIDLLSEFNFGHSVNAAKRDRGSSSEAPTDLTKEAFDAFLAGRAILASSEGALTADEMTALQGHRDLAVSAWEQAIAATVVHYVNGVLVDMGTIGTPDYSFEGHAKHWSEMKGFALILQFNPRSTMTPAEFAELHELLGQAPVLAGDADLADYAADLLEARALLAETGGFDLANLGDDHGEGGW